MFELVGVESVVIFGLVEYAVFLHLYRLVFLFEQC